MLQASLTAGEWGQWAEVVVTIGGLVGALWAWLFSRRCKIQVTLHFGGAGPYITSADGPIHAYGTCALVVQNVGSRIGRNVRFSAAPPLTLWTRPRGENQEPHATELDDRKLGDMSPTQRYEFAFELIDKGDLERLMASELAVRFERRWLWDYSTTIRLGDSGLQTVSLVDTTSPSGMVATPLMSIDHSLKDIARRTSGGL